MSYASSLYRSELQRWIDQFTKGENAIVGIAETNGCDTLYLYTLYKDEYNDRDGTRGGPIVTVGMLDGRPVCISLNVVIIRGKRVMFYSPTSQVVDYKMIEEYLDKMWPGIEVTDAINVHNLIR